MHDLSENELLETLHQLREVVELVDNRRQGVKSLTKAIAGKEAAARAIATEAGTEPFLLDMWEEQRSPIEVDEFAKKTLAHAEKVFAEKKKPDDRDEILAGEDFGVVFMPPELLRQLWGLGEAVVHFQDKQAESTRVEPRATEVMMLAAQWVRDARVRWGTPDRVEKVSIAPLLKVQTDQPF
jgi:hypothetical protein